ncbi:MAG TPA: MSMEG_6728 family protein [Acidimicrobiales bacterium]|nr:MSMEG_6728 family protein [Acidimicrobiales bacterium]
MQTFLPFPEFELTATVLDDRRLGKQRVEVLQILRALTRERYGWQSHPAVLMWAGYEEALGAYGLAVCRAWSRRGRPDTCDPKIRTELAALGIAEPRSQDELARDGGLPPLAGGPGCAPQPPGRPAPQGPGVVRRPLPRRARRRRLRVARPQPGAADRP